MPYTNVKFAIDRFYDFQPVARESEGFEF